jgi:hypothetical protein
VRTQYFDDSIVATATKTHPTTETSVLARQKDDYDNAELAVVDDGHAAKRMDDHLCMVHTVYG